MKEKCSIFFVTFSLCFFDALISLFVDNGVTLKETIKNDWSSGAMFS